MLKFSIKKNEKFEWGMDAVFIEILRFEILKNQNKNKIKSYV